VGKQEKQSDSFALLISSLTSSNPTNSFGLLRRIHHFPSLHLGGRIASITVRHSVVQRGQSS